MRLGINGRFSSARVTGVQRFAREITRRLGRECSGEWDVVLFLPADAARDEWQGMSTIRGTLPGRLWERIELPYQVRAANCTLLLSPGGTAPAGVHGNVVVLHDVLPLSHPGWFTRRYVAWFRFAAARAARGAAGVITTTRWARGEISQRLGIPVDRICVVTQGLAPFQRPAAAATVDRVRRELELPRPYLLAPGAGDPRKNLTFLERVLRRWRERDGEAPLLVTVGSRSSHIHRGADSGSAGGGSSGLRHLGYLTDEQLHALYTGAAVFCYPSLAEGFGRPPLEAMACGVPVLAADYAAGAEVLGAGASVRPLDVDIWVERLRQLSTPGPERSAAVLAGQHHAARFDWDAAAGQVREACRVFAGGLARERV